MAQTLTRSIREKPAWVRTFIILSILSIGIFALSYYTRIHQTSSLLPPSATTHERLVAEQFLWDEEIMRCAFVPVRLFIGWISLSLVLYYTCIAFSPRQSTRLKQIFSLEVHAESFLVFGNFISAMVAILSTPTLGKFATTPLSAALIYPEVTGIMHLFLNSLNIFQLLYIIVLIYGIFKITGFGVIKSLFIVSIVWAMNIFCNMAMIKFVQERLNMRF
ncbi:MAG: hypothetical protein ACHQQQ_07420 [Bacteroidota bacterium]